MLIETTRTASLTETRICRCGVEVLRVEQFTTFNSEEFDLEVGNGDRHNPNCKGAKP